MFRRAGPVAGAGPDGSCCGSTRGQEDRVDGQRGHDRLSVRGRSAGQEPAARGDRVRQGEWSRGPRDHGSGVPSPRGGPGRGAQRRGESQALLHPRASAPARHPGHRSSGDAHRAARDGTGSGGIEGGGSGEKSATAAADKPSTAPETPKERAKREANEAAEARDRERAQASAAGTQASAAEAQARERAAAESRARDQASAALREKEKEAQEKAQKANEEREKLGKDLAAVQDRERKEREDKEKLQKEKQDLEKQLAESKDREKKEREDKERLQKVNQDLEKQLIEARVKEKQERDAKDKLAAQDRERADLENKNKAARDKVAEGPDMPGSIPQPIFCPTQDQWAAGEDVFIHCAPQSEVKAKELALFYRPSGVLHFSSTLMERNQKGWYVAVIPAGRVSGRLLQYYVEARSAKGDSVASNGKALSPNVMMIRPRGSMHTEAAPVTPVEPTDAKLTAASSSTKADKSSSSRRGRARPR